MCVCRCGVEKYSSAGVGQQQGHGVEGGIMMMMTTMGVFQDMYADMCHGKASRRAFAGVWACLSGRALNG